jgi:HlyD family secretion protein
MKRATLTVLILTLLLAACGDSGRNALPGYMEAELVLVGAEDSGRIADLSVEEGGRVSAGDALFALESKTEKATVAAAKGRLDEAEAALSLSRLSLERAKDLRARGVAAQARLDDAQSVHDRNLAAVAAARAAYEEVTARLEKRTVAAPRGGTIEEVYFRVGEVVNSGQPVVAILPPGNLKVRFYVPEPLRAALRIGEQVSVACDGCPSGLSASVSFIAREAEYTPPVIFSREERGKLVYLVEARPLGDASRLTAGQPVTVTLVPPMEGTGS